MAVGVLQASTAIITPNNLIMGKLSFDAICEKLDYIHVDNTMDKTTDEVADEIRQQIRAMGWDCLDETFNEDADAEEWIKENHSDMPLSECEWYCIAETDFLCDNNGFSERMPGNHDVDWYTFHISFFGIWGKVGIFNINID